jgi:hypothetical protein
MDCIELRTAAEVREHARAVQRRINERRRAIALPAPPPRRKPPQPDDVPEDDPLDPRDAPNARTAVAIADSPPRSVFVIVSEFFGSSISELTGNSRHPILVLPRQIACFVARRLGFSYPRIGNAAQRDQSTVQYACRVISKRVIQDRAIAQLVNTIGSKAAVDLGTDWRPAGRAR